MIERLTTLAAVKEWLGIDTDTADAGLLRVLDAASQFTINYLNRDVLGKATYTQNFKGNGKSSMLLRNWPVIAVSSVGINGSGILPTVMGSFGLPGNGFTISDPRNSNQSVDLHGYAYGYGQSCQIVYDAGYATSQVVTISKHQEGEPPTDVITKVTPTNKGIWIGDLGVVGPNSVAYELVDADPVTGQYSVDVWGAYTFSLTDVDVIVTISYSYAPFDLSFGVTEMIGEWYKRRDRIGLLSKTLGGQETITFSKADMSELAQSNLQPYKNVIPL